MTRDGPGWLADLQRRFGDVIRTPLDRASGTLTSTPSVYDERVVRQAGADGLAVYNRQYWFRLFEAMQSAFPLTTRLFGAWAFNEHAARFLLEHPPRSWDLDRAPDGFERFLDEALDAAAPDRLVRVEAARIDAAWREVFRAPETTPFHPAAKDASGLLESRLTPSPAIAIVDEHYALMDLRRAVLAAPADGRVEPPPRLAEARSWALVRRDDGTIQVPLERREAELFALLGEASVGDALARLERACSEAERAELPQKARAWLARSVTLGFWISR